eukprot:TRINITY_DN4837_c0_g1_i1.p1 TRINITY_DN4837_c0_g1~~TRINITY_DN4837_c0_g1_i1.p1  ORF type:complete len:196 (-),score=39.47 TRINITY_DN4837_c0_g1_i1:97-684(-)
MGTSKFVPFWEKDLKVWDASHVVGLRSHYIATSIVAKKMVADKKGGLIVNISSPGGLRYLFDVAYGVGKAALDRLTADTAHQLAPHKVAVVSLWPGSVATEAVVQNVLNNPKAPQKLVQMFKDAESIEFSGRAVAALVKDPKVLDLTGKVLLTTELARHYGFTDVNGKIPGEDEMKMVRKVMQSPPSQWVLPSKL